METILNKKGNSSQILEWSIIHVFSKLHSCRLKRLFLREFTPSPQLRTFHATTVLPTVVGLFDFTLSLGNRNCRSAASFLPPQQLEAGKKDKKADNIWRERYLFHNAFPCTQGRAQVQFSQIDSNFACRQFSQRRVRSLAWGSAGRT